MDTDERDVVEFSDEDGNTLLLEVMDYFFYNGEEYAVLCDADAEAAENHQETPGSEMEPHEHSLYIMQVVNTVSEDGEEMEEFVSPDESLLEQLIEVVQTRFSEDDEENEDEE